MAVVYGDIVTNTNSDGLTRAWRAFLTYTTTDEEDYVTVTVTSCGVESMQAGSMSFLKEYLTQTLTMNGVKKKTYKNSDKIQISGVETRKILIATDYSVRVPKDYTATTVNINAPIKVTSGSWKGTSTPTLDVEIPAAHDITLAVEPRLWDVDDVKRCYLYCTLNNYDETGQLYYKVNVNVSLNAPENVIAAHPNLTISGNTLEVKTRIPYVLHSGIHPLVTLVEDGIEYDFSESQDYSFDVHLDVFYTTESYDEFHGFDNYTWELMKSFDVNVPLKGTKPDETPTEYTVTIDTLPPIIRTDGTAEMEVTAYNFFTGQWDVVAREVDCKVIKEGGDTKLNIKLDLGSDYLEDPLAHSTKARIKFKYDTSDTSEYEDHGAFFSTTRNTSYSNGLANVMFCGGSESPYYSSRVWYSYVDDPLYFPDDNFIEVGSNDTAIMGLTKIGEYLGIVKQGKTTDTSIYIAYPTSFENNTAYAVKPSVNGVGACARYAFNILGNDTLFLSKEGVMAIQFAENDVDKKVRNRSYFIDGKLLKEPMDKLSNAYSFVWNGFYLLAVDNEEDNGHVYILDGNQRNSWGNDRTNLVYECYYWTNVPAKCFAQFRNELWFSDGKRLCRFKTDEDEHPYNDNGEAIKAEWSTVLDDDGSAFYFKNLLKKGSMVTLLPCEEGTSCEVYIRVDDGAEQYIGTANSDETDMPIDFYLNKKVKKYKRLQVKVKNDIPDQGFGVAQIVKLYTLGNYSK